ncbi:hypothetical protein [Phenylobacterium sp. SCN 70-31]|uniref:hypothetical protein n=1 Tax=Phenylobacterium sp. SCN 70-31 TaxID=1660129 RepID=UPI00086E2F26|nr:hypothetical protein [Phenylobacterium sp. SCN 70-31]ODT88988.1 MAG: hypothetical protein ABS78_05165 [Phenylobacterium sp. SCN 70-31]
MSVSRDRAEPDAGEPSACKVGLTPAERLLFAGVRAWARMRISGHRPHQAVAAALGRRVSARTATLFIAWIQAVETGSRRPLALTCPDCGGVSTDAQRLIVACGSAPVDGALAYALLEPILRDPSIVIGLGVRLNRAMAAEGWPLPARCVEGESQTVH